MTKTTVAIMTMHAVLNYGSVLQAYALYHYLRVLGYVPYIVDYNFPNEYHMSISKPMNVFSESSRIRAHINGLCHRFLQIDESRKKQLFDEFIKDNMVLSRRYNLEQELQRTPPQADIYVTGSDQVWNVDYVGNDCSFFLHWVPKNKSNFKFSYASSFGGCVMNSERKTRIKPLLEGYRAISVRERLHILDEMQIPAEHVLDPIFLLTKDQWKTIISTEPIVKGKYIICYLLSYSFNPFPYAYDIINEIKKNTGYEVVMINGEPLNLLKGYKLFNDCGPQEFLNLFYYSSYVVTSSFHGTAFAINFNKPFVSIVNEHNLRDERQVSLVNQVGLNEECIIPMNMLQPLNGDYQVKNAIYLERERRKSRLFIENTLKSLQNNKDYD